MLSRDDYTCRYCGHRPEQLRAWQWGRYRATLHIDHVIPVAAGGLNTLSNLVTACERCNLRKGAYVSERNVAFVRRLERLEADEDAAYFTAWLEDLQVDEELRTQIANELVDTDGTVIRG